MHHLKLFNFNACALEHTRLLGHALRRWVCGAYNPYTIHGH
jgi:hypothetical protein